MLPEPAAPPTAPPTGAPGAPGAPGAGGGSIRLLLVRHGQSHWNAASLLQGQSPAAPGLTATGRRQAALVATELAGSGAQRVLSSDLLRASQTAAPIAAALGLQVELEPRLRERCLGSAEGRPAATLGAAGGLAGGVVVDPDTAPPGGETLRQLARRLAGLLEELRAGPDRTLVLVSHGWALRAARAHLSGEDWRAMSWAPLHNAAVLEARLDPGPAAARAAKR